ncbi:MAG: DNA polymerase III subunit gamma/tau, partial [Clostridiales bacterium]|nr:DNA polymerase III subunit gamma/tau [Clostridiales bacterium]
MYQALYRKWRPQVFADVVGQEHITRTLINEIETGRHSHAYLFTGSRGTGKTTCAKIFAKAVNCEHPVNGDPCNECPTCKGIDSGAIMDVIEIDAASNNGVDNIRDIRDEANFTPVGGKYRVYIIDEVHMLSTGAFNALLKTLEEPPAHVKFILATTEVHKLPATILSRCQRFDFRRITPEDIAKRLSYVAEREDLILEPDAAQLIARLADGALRDALSILDQCIGHSRHITLDVVNATVGLAGKEYLFALGTSILNKDGASALTQINLLHNNSCDMERLCNELTNHFRNLMICKAVKNPEDLVISSKEELAEYKRISAAYSMDFILEVLNVLGDTLSNLRRGLNRRVEMEMAIIRLCNSETESLLPNAEPIEVKPLEAPKPVVFEPAPLPDPEPEPEPIPEPEPKPEPEPAIEDYLPADEPESSEPVAENEVSVEDYIPSEGALPTETWNAIIREVVTTDKVLIGSMNSARAHRKGDCLVVETDNVLLRRFLPQD